MAPTTLQDPSLVDQGLLGRCLLSWTKSLAGTRLCCELAPDHTEALPRYHLRLQTLRQHPGAALSTLELDEAAYGQWQAYQADLDTRLETFATTGLSRPMALHAADNALRLAGILSVMEDRAAITQPVMARAAVLMDFYRREAQRLAVEAIDKARLEEAERLGRWLQRKGWQQFALRQLNREGPRLARQSAAHTRVRLDLLVRHHWLLALGHDSWALNPLPAH